MRTLSSRRQVSLIAFLLSLGAVSATIPYLAASPPDDPLTTLRGRRAVIEFPDLEHFGSGLPLPDGWGYHQATGDTLESLQQRLGVDAIPAIVCLDAYGNILVRDVTSNCRRQIKGTLGRFDRRERELRQKLARWWKDANAAREADKAVRELSRITSILEQGVLGYPEVIAATERRAELDQIRRRELLEVLASEGLQSTARCLAQLKDLAKVSKGLPVHELIQRERKRFEAGFEVEPK